MFGRISVALPGDLIQPHISFLKWTSLLTLNMVDSDGQHEVTLKGPEAGSRAVRDVVDFKPS